MPSHLPLLLSLNPLSKPKLLKPTPPPPLAPLLEASKGSSQAGDQVQGVEGAKDKGKGNETKPLLAAHEAAEAEDAVVRLKEAEARSKEADPKAKDSPTSQPSKKEDPPPPKAKA